MTQPIYGRVLASGAAELANELPAGDYFLDTDRTTVSLLGAPLKTEKGVLGAILLIGGDTRQFTAGDLKLVNAIAMQTAPAIEIAYLHQLELEKASLERDLQMAHQVQAVPSEEETVIFQIGDIVLGPFVPCIDRGDDVDPDPDRKSTRLKGGLATPRPSRPSRP